MILELNEFQKQLKQTARDFLKNECPLYVVREVELSDKGYSYEIWQKMADLGWLGMLFPEKYGGEGCSLLDMAILYEEMGRALLPSPHLSSTILSGLTILGAGSEEQKTKWLPKIASGKVVFTLAVTEPECDWDIKSLGSVSAVSDESGFVLNGTKMFIPYAHVADYILCVTRTRDRGAPEEGITLFIIETNNCSGLKSRRLAGSFWGPFCELTLSNVTVSSDNILGKLNEGWPALTNALRQGTVMQCCEMIGGAEFVYELTMGYAKQRMQFGQYIGSFQRVQDRIINMLTDLDKAKLVTYEAAWMLSAKLTCELEVSVAKAVASEAYANICDESHYVHAGTGFMDDYSLYPYTRKAKTAAIYLGNPTLHRKVIANELRKRA